MCTRTSGKPVPCRFSSRLTRRLQVGLSALLKSSRESWALLLSLRWASGASPCEVKKTYVMIEYVLLSELKCFCFLACQEMNKDQLLAVIRREKENVRDRIIAGRDWHLPSVAVLEVLMRREEARPFMESPVDAAGPRYTDVVKKPMWLSKVFEKLQRFDYNTKVGFLTDVRIIFQNCYLFHDAAAGQKALIAAAAALEIEFEHQAVQRGLDAAADTAAIRTLWVKLDKTQRVKASQTIMQRYNESTSSIKNEATRKRLLLFLREHEHLNATVRSAPTRLPQVDRTLRNQGGLSHVSHDEPVVFNDAPFQLPQNEHRYTVDFAPMHSEGPEGEDG